MKSNSWALIQTFWPKLQFRCAPLREQKSLAASKHFLAGAFISRAARDNIISLHTARHIIKHSILQSMCRQAGCAGEPNAICDGMSWERAAPAWGIMWSWSVYVHRPRVFMRIDTLHACKCSTRLTDSQSPRHDVMTDFIKPSWPCHVYVLMHFSPARKAGDSWIVYVCASLCDCMVIQ